RDPKKIYVIDTGMRNIHARSLQDDMGKLAENIVYLELRRRNHEIFYYQDRTEVDFITTRMGKPDQAIQVCYSDMENETTFRRERDALIHCLKSLSLSAGKILTMNREEHLSIEGIAIEMVPLYKYLTDKW
ncbi:MAG: ATP-binding protein, partial [Oligoflexales bacterium]|nr:ATP-binding protein [Oligoflexales bacterium]